MTQWRLQDHQPTTAGSPVTWMTPQPHTLMLQFIQVTLTHSSTLDEVYQPIFGLNEGTSFR